MPKYHDLSKVPSPEKAKKMLKDGKVKGKPLTKKQKRFFGHLSSR